MDKELVFVYKISLYLDIDVYQIFNSVAFIVWIVRVVFTTFRLNPTQLLREFTHNGYHAVIQDFGTSYGVNMFTSGCHHVSQYPNFSLENNDYTVGQNDYQALLVSAAHYIRRGGRKASVCLRLPMWLYLYRHSYTLTDFYVDVHVPATKKLRHEMTKRVARLSEEAFIIEAWRKAIDECYILN